MQTLIRMLRTKPRRYCGLSIAQFNRRSSCRSISSRCKCTSSQTLLSIKCKISTLYKWYQMRMACFTLISAKEEVDKKMLKLVAGANTYQISMSGQILIKVQIFAVVLWRIFVSWEVLHLHSSNAFVFNQIHCIVLLVWKYLRELCVKIWTQVLLFNQS